MTERNVIHPHMEVVGSDGGHIGTVDGVEGDRIKLTKSGSEDGRHHYIQTAIVQDIVGNTVTVTTTADEAMASATGD